MICRSAGVILLLLTLIVMGCRTNKISQRPVFERMDVTIEKSHPKFPRKQLEATLRAREKELEDLRDSLNSNATQVTKFAVSGTDKKRLENGRVETAISLTVKGTRPVSIFYVRAKTRNGLKIKKLDVSGDKRLDAQIYSYRKSSDETSFEKTILAMPAEDVSIRIVTAGEPQGMEVQIDPLE